MAPAMACGRLLAARCGAVALTIARDWAAGGAGRCGVRAAGGDAGAVAVLRREVSEIPALNTATYRVAVGVDAAGIRW
eukprot:COSAG01_NODE_533_length_15816_cov_4.518738_10_plen_78_part_00